MDRLFPRFCSVEYLPSDQSEQTIVSKLGSGNKRFDIDQSETVEDQSKDLHNCSIYVSRKESELLE